MTISVILSTKGSEVISAAPDQTVAEAVATLAEHRIGAVPVVEDGEVVGVFSERDVIYGLRDGDAAVLSRPIREVMTSPALTATPGDAVLGALSLMTRRRLRHLPVVDGGKIVGIVSIGDLVKYRIDRIEAEAAAMRDYITQA
jgi:CBS domain-containing protein